MQHQVGAEHGGLQTQTTPKLISLHQIRSYYLVNQKVARETAVTHLYAV